MVTQGLLNNLYPLCVVPWACQHEFQWNSSCFSKHKNSLFPQSKVCVCCLMCLYRQTHAQVDLVAIVMSWVVSCCINEECVVSKFSSIC